MSPFEDAVLWWHAHGTFFGNPFEHAAARWHELRAEFDLYRESAYERATDATNGVLLNREGRAAGIDSWSLFSGPRARAYRYASDELREWWALNGRLTVTEFVAQRHQPMQYAAVAA